MWNSVSMAAEVIVVPAPLAQAGGIAVSSRLRATPYDASHGCTSVHRAQRPASDAIEDGLAYVLDIPPAMISPPTCPVGVPLLETLDSDKSRTHPSCRIR
jgi:hypothetical protein